MATKKAEVEVVEAAAYQAKSPFAAFEFTDTPPVVVRAPGMKLDATQFKRSKMIEGIEIQKRLWENPNYTVQRTEYRETGEGGRRSGVQVDKMPRKWFSKSPSGKVVMEARYGQRAFEVMPGKKYVVLSDEQVIPFLDTLAEEVAKGAFDQQLLDLGTRSTKDK